MTADLAALLLARAAVERAEAARMDAAADPIRAAMHYHCAMVLEEVARATEQGRMEASPGCRWGNPARKSA